LIKNAPTSKWKSSDLDYFVLSIERLGLGITLLSNLFDIEASPDLPKLYDSQRCGSPALPAEATEHSKYIELEHLHRT
jgi:hypothetical protein